MKSPEFALRTGTKRGQYGRRTSACVATQWRRGQGNE
jgi:hypothetical protein